MFTDMFSFFLLGDIVLSQLNLKESALVSISLMISDF